MDKEVLFSIKKNKNGTFIISLQYCKEGVYLKSTGVSLSFGKRRYIDHVSAMLSDHRIAD
ncbi:MAG: hypothetical protein ABR974_14120 [Bacteroidales bacterium]|jgi:hypothetical protein